MLLRRAWQKRKEVTDLSDFLIDDNWKIGNVNINGRLVLAPMAGVTDLPFRMLCKEYGADLLYTEMVSAKGVFYKSKNTWPLMA
ncbi:MAG: tRNA-dihydrouridine synthase, partial [Eubacterium sp.]|nr:tRNA-dihydrouridine synthase [Eubacterium sp.]